MFTNAHARQSSEAPCATGEARSDAANGGDPTALTMRVMAEAVEPRARVYIYAHRNEVGMRSGKTGTKLAAEERLQMRPSRSSTIYESSAAASIRWHIQRVRVGLFGGAGAAFVVHISHNVSFLWSGP